MRDQLVPFQTQITGTVWAQTDTLEKPECLERPCVWNARLSGTHPIFLKLRM